MKQITKLMIVAASAAALVSCAKEKDFEPVLTPSKGIQISVIADMPKTESATKTELNSDKSVSWKTSDKVGFINGEDGVNVESSAAVLDAEGRATFTASVPSEGTYHAYYPYYGNYTSTAGANGVAVRNGSGENSQHQHPALTSFDPASDILISEPFQVSASGSYSTDPTALRFRRLGAFIKLTFVDNTTGHVLSEDYATEISVQGPDKLVGKAWVSGNGLVVESGWKKVIADYDANTFALTSNSAWFGVFPQTFAQGSQIIVSFTTNKRTFEKTLTLPKEVVLGAGNILPIRVKLEDDDVVQTVTMQKMWGNYGVAGTAGWPAYVTGAEDLDTFLRNACFDDDYVYIPKTSSASADGNFIEASIFMFKVSDGSYAGKVQRTTDPDYMAATWASTFPVSCARIMKNTDTSLNGGKDILVCTNLSNGQNVRLYAWENGVNNQPRLLTNFGNSRRFGDRISVEGSYQDGRVWYRSFAAGMTAYLNFVPEYTKGFNDSHVWNWVEALGFTAVADGDNMMTEYTSFNNGSYGIVSSNSGLGTYLISGTTTEKTYSGYKNCFGWHAFTLGGVSYLAYLDMSGGTNLPIVTILQGESDTLEHLKATLDKKKIAGRAGIATENQNDFSTAGVYATNGVGDCQIREIGGSLYVLGMTRGGIALFKVTND